MGYIKRETVSCTLRQNHEKTRKIWAILSLLFGFFMLIIEATSARTDGIKGEQGGEPTNERNN